MANKKAKTDASLHYLTAHSFVLLGETALLEKNERNTSLAKMKNMASLKEANAGKSVHDVDLTSFPVDVVF